MRGTFVPLYGLNNMFGQIPIVGLFLGGGSNEGLFGMTYEVDRPAGTPRLRVNPISAMAPGLLRKFFEFRDRHQRSARSPSPDAMSALLDRLQQHVPLLAERQLDHAFGREVARLTASSSRR